MKFFKKKGNEREPEAKVISKESHEKKKRKKSNIKKRIKKSQSERRRWFAEHIEKAGYEITPFNVEYIMNRVSAALASLFILYMLTIGVKNNVPLLQLSIILFLSAVVGFFLATILLNVGFRIFLDLKKFQRKLMVEDVLPDFFQLASANIRAGMPIDRALWFAVRPRFGVLAKEIEEVAKKTLGGGNLDEALVDFAKKYDSDILLRSVNLLNEGMKAGGNVGDLLDKISSNIQEMKILKKEMAANVTTYAIFITFAAIVAAPLLFGLSGQLLVVVQEITEDIDMSGTEMEGGDDMGLGIAGVAMEFSGEGETINQDHYRIFVYVCLTFSSILSAMIVSIIKKGNVKEGGHLIPVYMIVSYTIYLVSAKVMSIALGGIM